VLVNQSSFHALPAVLAMSHGALAATHGGGATPGLFAVCYSDQKVANREIRVWHLVVENGY
jgi:hypothetical protein